jgi:hypothetical protein
MKNLLLISLFLLTPTLGFSQNCYTVKGVENKTPTEIAELELKNNMIPFKIKRRLPNGKFEIWRLSELEK